MSKKRNLNRVKQRKQKFSASPPPAPQRKKRKTKVDYRQEKINWLISQGYSNPLDSFTVNQIDSIKISDIRKGTLTADDVPFLKSLYTDFDKEKRLGKYEHLFFAFRSFSGNTSLDFIISYETQKSNKNLLETTKNLMLLDNTFDGDVGTSSGKDGDIRFEMADIPVMKMNAALVKSFNKMSAKKSRRRHRDGEFIGWQILTQGKNDYFSRISFRDILIIYNALAGACVEYVRVDFTRWMYETIALIFPKFIQYLPSQSDIDNVHQRMPKVRKRRKNS